jgi:hypothetical protein
LIDYLWISRSLGTAGMDAVLAHATLPEIQGFRGSQASDRCIFVANNSENSEEACKTGVLAIARSQVAMRGARRKGLNVL